MNRTIPASLRLLAAMTLLGCSALALAQETVPAAAPTSGDDTICTDRPSKSNGTCTVPAGFWQVESDILNFTHDHEAGVTTDTLLVTNPTLKYGFSPDIDLQVNLAPLEVVRTRSAQGSTTETGLGDLYLRLKYNFYNSPHSFFDVAVVPYIKLPTARLGIGDGVVEEGLNSVFKFQLSPSFALTTGPEFDVFRNSANYGRHVNLSNLINLSSNLSDTVAISEEFWADWNFDPSGTVRQASFDESLAWTYDKHDQLDLGANIGLNHRTPGLQVYVGYSRLFK